MDLLRKPVFILALVLILIVVLIEVGGVELLRRPAGQVASFGQMLSGREDLRDALDELDQGELQAVLSQPKPPGRAIRYMALLDGMLLFTVALMGLSLVISHRVQGRVQGIATLIFSLLLILGAITMIIAALLALLLMVALFLAVPFGTLAYLDHNAWYLLAMVIFWLILDYFSLYLPLSAMKSRAQSASDQNRSESS